MTSGQQFFGASVKKLFMPKLTVINTESFYGCAIRNVVFKSLTSIGGYGFANSSIKNLVLEANQVVTIGSSTFNGTAFKNSNKGTAYVPYNQVANYNANSVWSSLASTGYTIIKSIQENLIELQELDVYKFELSDYYDIVTELPTTDIDDTIVYFIETATAGTYEQWFHGSGQWAQLPDNIKLSED